MDAVSGVVFGRVGRRLPHHDAVELSLPHREGDLVGEVREDDRAVELGVVEDRYSGDKGEDAYRDEELDESEASARLLFREARVLFY